VGVYSAVITPL